jgi:glutamine synthetase
VACGDNNPYLALAVILGAALAGIEEKMEPPAPITGNAYALDLPGLASDWETAIDLFESDPLIARILPAELIEHFCRTKRQEKARLDTIPQEERWLVYLEAV